MAVYLAFNQLTRSGILEDHKTLLRADMIGQLDPAFGDPAYQIARMTVSGTFAQALDLRFFAPTARPPAMPLLLEAQQQIAACQGERPPAIIVKGQTGGLRLWHYEGGIGFKFSNLPQQTMPAYRRELEQQGHQVINLPLPRGWRQKYCAK